MLSWPHFSWVTLYISFWFIFEVNDFIRSLLLRPIIVPALQYVSYSINEHNALQGRADGTVRHCTASHGTILRRIHTGCVAVFVALHCGASLQHRMAPTAPHSVRMNL